MALGNQFIAIPKLVAGKRVAAVSKLVAVTNFMISHSKELEMTSLTNLDFAAIYSDAMSKVILAGREYDAKYGEDMYC